MTSPRLSYITWMKAVGMLLIVYGHVGAWLPGAVLPPINTKQIGVAFFVFITGATLARDTRRGQDIVLRRLFEIVVFAALVALVVSGVGAWWDGNLRESNYLPLLFGANVLIDAFPANPTTWYVGTYIHLIVFAALLHGRWDPGWRGLALLAAAEIGIRALLLGIGLTFVPYMLLTNWVTLYFLGRLWGRGDRAMRHPAVAMLAVAAAAIALLMLPALRSAFPFFVPATPSAAGFVFVSASVTLLYTATTIAAAQVFSVVGQRVPALIQVIADHTLLIFLAHMPVVFALIEVTTSLFGRWRVPVLFVACVVIPIGASMLLRRTMKLDVLRERALTLVPALERS